jgi:hypothetical protein
MFLKKVSGSTEVDVKSYNAYHNTGNIFKAILYIVYTVFK